MSAAISQGLSKDASLKLGIDDFYRLSSLFSAQTQEEHANRLSLETLPKDFVKKSKTHDIFHH